MSTDRTSAARRHGEDVPTAHDEKQTIKPVGVKSLAAVWTTGILFLLWTCWLIYLAAIVAID